ncbi:N-acetylmuramoyl-L-alanine amidase [Mycolicibacterium llatzerense]|uniref:N-acetylmuramoyl-L-alanine amidase n=1 Tax=Mycolicibacterium llatzerense TaxID=280871 RepID=UPI0005BCBC3F|nr:N-acetylmuramoyl-L-alanine amidase [Mycolicibacterium llatzerense]
MPRRRPAPSILLSALAATVVMVPLAVSGIPGIPGLTDDKPSAPELRTQPLAGVGGGQTVREIHQDTPFSLVALTASDFTGTSARVRAQKADGSWGPWYEVEAPDGVGEARATTRGTEPVFVGRTTTVQIAVTRPAEAAATPPDANRPQGPGLGYRPVDVEKPLGPSMKAVLISPPEAPADVQFQPTAVSAPNQPPNIISRAQWGANEGVRCGQPVYDPGVRAAIVHHTAGSNDYAPEDSAGIVRSIYEYHTRELGWCDIAYNALVDKYGQVFEGRFGGMTRPVEGSHTGGFNVDTWGVAMLGDFDVVPPTPLQLKMTGRLIGWRLSLDHVNPLGSVVLTSGGGTFTHFPAGATPTLPTIFTHRDVGNTDCPGNAAYAAMGELRDIAASVTAPPGALSAMDMLRGGAIFDKWQAMGGAASPLGVATSPEAAADGHTRYATFDHGAMYWSPATGAQPLTGALYDAWGALGFERGALGLPTSGEIPEPQWIVQNFQHGTLNFDREHATVTRVIDGVPQELPPLPQQEPVQLERFSRIEMQS